MCRTLEVSRSGFYDWLGREESARAAEDRRLANLIAGIFAESRRTYGAPRVHRELRHRGVRCGRKRVARLMKAAGLRSKVLKRFRVRTTDSNHNFAIAPDLVGREFAVSAPNLVWVADITYIPTDEGWLYLASTMDLFSRRIVGWSMSESLDAEFVLNATRAALHDRRPAPGLIHHSDRGSQYACKRFRDLLRDHGVRSSMSRTGDCFDNAAKESFFHTLKTELVHGERFETRAAARAAVFDYIEAFYNPRRLHSTLGYRSPANFEREHSPAMGA